MSEDLSHKIEFVDQLPSADEEKMRLEFVAHETGHAVDVNYKRFSVVLRDERGEAVGVINAFTAYSEIYIDDIWVAAAVRRKGLGRRLIQALEEHFAQEGFNNINLVTSAFQAPGFYQKCGFQLEFIRHNKGNPKLTKYFFVKFFQNHDQTQGIRKG